MSDEVERVSGTIGRAAKKERAIKILLDFHRARSTRVFTTFESGKAISTVIVIESRDGRRGKILLIQLPFPGSKVFSLVVLIKRERATRMPDSFFLFLCSHFSREINNTCIVCEIFAIDDRSFILSTMNALRLRLYRSISGSKKICED